MRRRVYVLFIGMLCCWGISPRISAQSVFTQCAGVTITSTSAAGMAAQADCANINATLLPGAWTGTACTGFVRYDFPAPITSVRIEYFSVNTHDYAVVTVNNGGVVTITGAGCSVVSGVNLGPYNGGGAYGTTAYQVTSTVPFTQLTLANTGCSSGWVGDCATNIILDVEMDEFEAKSGENGVVDLHWRTLVETNNAYFAVERSVDGTEWQKIGEVTGHGTTHAPHDYDFQDGTAHIGRNLYRLKQYDFDGSHRMSGVETALVDQYVRVFPTVTSGRFQVIGVASAADVVVFDQMGRRYFPPASAQGGGFSFDMSRFEAGIYLLTMRAGAQQLVQRIVLR